MHRAAVVRAVAKVLAQGLFLVLGDVDGVLHQFVHALVLRRGDRHHGHAQHAFHAVDVHRAAVAPHFVHHVQGHHHGHVHFQQLHGQVQVALDVSGVHNVDDGLGLLFQHEVPAHQLLAGIGRHGVNARQVGNQGVVVAAHRAVLAVHRHAGEVAHVLVGAGKLVEQGGLAAVLVTHQGEGQQRAFGERVAAALGMELAFLAQAGVGDSALAGIVIFRGGRLRHHFSLDFFRVRQAQGQLVAVDAQLHGVAQGRQLHQRRFRAGNHAHV